MNKKRNHGEALAEADKESEIGTGARGGEKAKAGKAHASCAMLIVTAWTSARMSEQREKGELHDSVEQKVQGKEQHGDYLLILSTAVRSDKSEQRVQSEDRNDYGKQQGESEKWLSKLQQLMSVGQQSGDTSVESGAAMSEQQCLSSASALTTLRWSQKLC